MICLSSGVCDDEMNTLIHRPRTQLITIIFIASPLWAQQTSSSASAELRNALSKHQRPKHSTFKRAAQVCKRSRQLLSLPTPADAREIVRQAVEVDHHNFERAQKYTCVQRQVIKQLGQARQCEITEIKTYDVNFYFGEVYEKLVQISDKALNEKEQNKRRREVGKVSGQTP